MFKKIALFVIFFSACKAPNSVQPESSSVEAYTTMDKYDEKTKQERNGREGIQYYLWAQALLNEPLTSPTKIAYLKTLTPDEQEAYQNVNTLHYCFYYWAHEVGDASKFAPDKYFDGHKLETFPDRWRTFNKKTEEENKNILKKMWILNRNPIRSTSFMRRLELQKDANKHWSKNVNVGIGVAAVGVTGIAGNLLTDMFKPVYEKMSAQGAVDAAAATGSKVRLTCLTNGIRRTCNVGKQLVRKEERKAFLDSFKQSVGSGAFAAFQSLKALPGATARLWQRKKGGMILSGLFVIAGGTMYLQDDGSVVADTEAAAELFKNDRDLEALNALKLEEVNYSVLNMVKETVTNRIDISDVEPASDCADPLKAANSAVVDFSAKKEDLKKTLEQK